MIKLFKRNCQIKNICTYFEIKTQKWAPTEETKYIVYGNAVTGSVGGASQAFTISLYFNEYVLFLSVTGCVEGLYPEGQTGTGPGVRQV